MTTEPTPGQVQLGEEIHQQWPSLDEDMQKAFQLRAKAERFLIEEANKHKLSANDTIEILYVLNCWALTQFLGLLPADARVEVTECMGLMAINHSQEEYGSLGLLIQEHLKNHPKKA